MDERLLPAMIVVKRFVYPGTSVLRRGKLPTEGLDLKGATA
jgi:hypothetical protein